MRCLCLDGQPFHGTVYISESSASDPNYFFVLSERGKDQLVHEGFTFKFGRLRSGATVQSWRLVNMAMVGGPFSPVDVVSPAC